MIALHSYSAGLPSFATPPTDAQILCLRYGGSSTRVQGPQSSSVVKPASESLDRYREFRTGVRLDEALLDDVVLRGPESGESRPVAQPPRVRAIGAGEYLAPTSQVPRRMGSCEATCGGSVRHSPHSDVDRNAASPGLMSTISCRESKRSSLPAMKSRSGSVSNGKSAAAPASAPTENPVRRCQKHPGSGSVKYLPGRISSPTIHCPWPNASRGSPPGQHEVEPPRLPGREPDLLLVTVLPRRNRGIPIQLVQGVPAVPNGHRPPAGRGSVQRDDQHSRNRAAVVVDHLPAQVVDVRIRRRDADSRLGSGGPQDGVMRVSPPAWANRKPFWSTLATAGVLEPQTGSTC